MARRGWLGAVIALAVIAVPAHAQKLEWKFKQGEKFWMETKTDVKQTLTVAGMPMKPEMTNTTVASFTVISAMGTTVVLEETIESISVKANAPMGGGASVDKIMQEMKGAKFKVTLDTAKLDVTKFEGYDELIKKISGGDQMVEKFIRAVMTEETLKESAEEIFAFLPPKPEDKTWERSPKVPLGPLGTLEGKYKYTNAGTEKVNNKDAVKITVEASLAWKAPAPAAAAGLPFQVKKGQLDAKDAKGTILFDAEAGKLVKSDMKMQLNGKLTLAVGGADVELDMQQDQTVTMQYHDKNPVK